MGMCQYNIWRCQPNKQPIIWKTICETVEKDLRWQTAMKGTDLVPIDVHTPMWLWIRGKFEVEI